MARKLHLSRGNLAFVAIVAVIVIVVGYFAVRPRLHPKLIATDVTHVRVFASGERHYEWLLYDETEISRLVDMFNAGQKPVIDREPEADAPAVGLLFILSNGNGITVSAAPSSAAPGQVEVARGQYQYRLDAPALADYINGLTAPAAAPAEIAAASDQIDAFLAARGLNDVTAESAVCTANGQKRISDGDKGQPTGALYASHTLLSVSQEEYSPWEIDPSALDNVLIVSVEWEADLTDYGQQYLAGTPEAEGHGRLLFLLVRTGADAPWMIEDWE